MKTRWEQAREPGHGHGWMTRRPGLLGAEMIPIAAGLQPPLGARWRAAEFVAASAAKTRTKAKPRKTVKGVTLPSSTNVDIKASGDSRVKPPGGFARASRPRCRACGASVA